MKPLQLLAAAALIFAATAAQAEHGGAKHVCKSGKVERLVSISYQQDGKKVPCSVKYKRDAQAEEKAIFNASVEEGYCEKKAEEFVKKLSDTGWTCSSGS